MDVGYIQRTVGTPLTECLGEVNEKRPEDPITYIAHWLYRYIDSEMYFRDKAAMLHEMDFEAQRVEKENAARFKRMEELKAITGAMEEQLGIGKDKDSQDWARLFKRLHGAGDDRASWRSSGSGSTFTSKDQFQRKGSKPGRRTTKSGSMIRRPGGGLYLATWELECPPGLLVCNHPLLGALMAKQPTFCAENPDNWYSENFKCMSLYDHEIYTHCTADQENVEWPTDL